MTLGSDRMPLRPVSPQVAADGFLRCTTGKEQYICCCVGGDPQDEINPEEEGVSAKLHQERAPWQNDRLHRKIVDAALSGARAMAAFQDVPLLTVCPHLSYLHGKCNTSIAVRTRDPRESADILC